MEVKEQEEKRDRSLIQDATHLLFCAGTALSLLAFRFERGGGLPSWLLFFSDFVLRLICFKVVVMINASSFFWVRLKYLSMLFKNELLTGTIHFVKLL